MPQFQALKDLRHDNKLVHAGSVVPAAWVDEWEGYENNTITKMKRNGMIQVLPGDEELPEAEPVDLMPGLSPTSVTSAERAAIQEFLGVMGETEALEYVREHGLVQDVDAAVEVDPATVDVAASFENDTSQLEEEEESFDPSEYSVADVRAFVEENPDMAGAVLDAEAAGKNRSTLTSWLEAFIEELPDTEETGEDDGSGTET